MMSLKGGGVRGQAGVINIKEPLVVVEGGGLSVSDALLTSLAAL